MQCYQVTLYHKFCDIFHSEPPQTYLAYLIISSSILFFFKLRGSYKGNMEITGVRKT